MIIASEITAQAQYKSVCIFCIWLFNECQSCCLFAV